MTASSARTPGVRRALWGVMSVFLAAIFILGSGWLLSSLSGAARVNTIYLDRIEALRDLQRMLNLLNRPAGDTPVWTHMREPWERYLTTALTPEEAVIVEETRPLVARLKAEAERGDPQGRAADPAADMAEVERRLTTLFERLCDLQVSVTSAELNVAQRDVATALIVALVVITLTAGAVAMAIRYMERHVVKPIHGTAGRILGLARGDLAAPPASLDVNDDFATVNNALRLLTTQLAERENLMRRLEESLSDLHEAQQELIEKGKLASLGRLVAGVAHELNTPIGSALTFASTIHDEATTFGARLEGNQIRRSELTAFASGIRGASGHAVEVLRRAAGLIASFKQVAADQTSLRCRCFDLGEATQQILDTLRPAYKGMMVDIVSTIPPGVAMNTCPGVLAQVLTNLVSNAVLHGLEGRADGRVEVALRASDAGQVVITVQDNGCGMPPDVVSRIFEPFFTTRMGRGGTGLGMVIVRNLVVGPLGGRIAVSSTPSVGTCFTLSIPRNAPLLQPEAEAYHVAR